MYPKWKFFKAGISIGREKRVIRSFSGILRGEGSRETEEKSHEAGHIGAVSLALCAAAGAAMFALSGGKKAEYCSLGEYHGRVAIFAPDERTLPRQITAIAVHTLPSADRAALSGGIAVYSREELYARLEDFGS